MLKIITAPNDILNQPVKPVKKIDERIKKLVNQMEKTLVAQTDPLGVGLAAPQVGEKLALFIIKPTKKAKTKVFINPKILKWEMGSGNLDKNMRTEKNDSHLTVQNPVSHLSPHSSKPKSFKLEGCLSIPRIWGPVRRADKILVEFQDLTGKPQKRWFRGLSAIIIQHEIDHLNGVLFTQKTLEQKLPLYEEKEGKLEKISATQ